MGGKLGWACNSCGAKYIKWQGSCSSCNEWNTLEIILVEVKERYAASSQVDALPEPVDQIPLVDFPRIQSQLEEFDRLLGGGVVTGSLNLLAGAPGIGKSTLLLQLAHLFARENQQVLYVSGEESKAQTSMRARRVGALAKDLLIMSETSYDKIVLQIQKIRPAIVMIDSIQILYKNDIAAAAGSIVQLRELASAFLHLCKKQNITIFLVGHVTKSGEIAGPRVLEHLVDAVFEFEGDKSHGFRLLRSIKNRFGGYFFIKC